MLDLENDAFSAASLEFLSLTFPRSNQVPIFPMVFFLWLRWTALAVTVCSLAEQFVEKSPCAQPLGELTSLDAHGEFGGSGGGSSPPSSSLCTEPLIPTTPLIPSEEMAKIACSLETKELWDKFHELGTEMIITKSGR